MASYMDGYITKFSYLYDLQVAFDLVGWCERMNITEFWPSQRNHAAGAVELHCTASKRNHSLDKAKIFRCQMENIAQHLRFGMMPVENRVRKILRCTP